MGLIRDRIGQVLLDKIGDKWADMLAASTPNVPLYDVLTEVDDSDVITPMSAGTADADSNLALGTNEWQKFSQFLSGLGVQLSNEGPYTVDTWLSARYWRVHRYVRGILNSAGYSVSRLNTFCERTSLGSFTQGGAFAAGSDIPATCGPMPLMARCGAVKGAAGWTLVTTVVSEGPTTTLAATITDVALAMTVADETGFPVAGLPGVSFLILMDSECIQVTATGGADDWTIVRARKGTAAAAHTVGATVYLVTDEAGVIPGSTNDTAEYPVSRLSVTALSLSGQATVNATGIGGTADCSFALPGQYAMIRDRTCPQKLAADCTASDTVVVEDASVFHPGDYVILVDDNTAAEFPLIVRDLDADLNTVYLTAACAGTFTTDQSARLMLTYTTINEGAAFAEGDVTLTVAAATALPVVGLCPFSIMIEDEILSVTNIVGNNLTVTRGTQSTIDCEHANLVPVILCPTNWNEDAPTYNRTVERGNQEWGIISTVAANSVVMSTNLLHSYGLCGYVEPLCRDLVLVATGAGGNAGDLVTIVSREDAVISRAD